MFNMAGYAEVKRLIGELQAVENQQMPNELEMLRSLKLKYTKPLTPDPFDQISLNVMLRNVEIRKGYRFEPRKDGGRIINLPHIGASEKD